MKCSKQIRSDYFPVKPGHGCPAVPRCCADEADALDTAYPPLLGQQSCGGFQPSPEDLQGQPRPSPVALVKPFACSMSSRASSETRGAEHGPTSVPKFLCALEIVGQHPKGIEITKIQPGRHHVNYCPLAVVFPISPFIALCSAGSKQICL